MAGKENLRRCPHCQKMYVETGAGCCPECAQKRDRQRQQVKEYLYTHSGAKAKQVMRETGVPIEIIMEMMKSGGLVEKGKEPTHPCRGCGAPIRRGRYCKKCHDKFQEAAKKHREWLERQAAATAKPQPQEDEEGLGKKLKDGFLGLLGGKKEAEKPKAPKKEKLDHRPEPRRSAPPEPKSKGSGFYSIVDRYSGNKK